MYVNESFKQCLMLEKCKEISGVDCKDRDFLLCEFLDNLVSERLKTDKYVQLKIEIEKKKNELYKTKTLEVKNQIRLNKKLNGRETFSFLPQIITFKE